MRFSKRCSTPAAATSASPGAKRELLNGDDELAVVGHHKISFVAVMRGLGIAAARCVKLDHERTVRERLDEAFALGPFRGARAGQALQQSAIEAFSMSG